MIGREFGNSNFFGFCKFICGKCCRFLVSFELYFVILKAFVCFNFGIWSGVVVSVGRSESVVREAWS